MWCAFPTAVLNLGIVVGGLPLSTCFSVLAVVPGSKDLQCLIFTHNITTSAQNWCQIYTQAQMHWLGGVTPSLRGSKEKRRYFCACCTQCLLRFPAGLPLSAVALPDGGTGSLTGSCSAGSSAELVSSASHCLQSPQLPTTVIIHSSLNSFCTAPLQF